MVSLLISYFYIVLWKIKKLSKNSVFPPKFGKLIPLQLFCLGVIILNIAFTIFYGFGNACSGQQKPGFKHSLA